MAHCSSSAAAETTTLGDKESCRERLVHKQTISSDPTGINAFALVLVAAPLPDALERPRRPLLSCKFIPTKERSIFG